ncbi:hypothetical protein FLAVO9AF_750040 [Flavobacterium sp. 9AF]|uniref:hypothetical protein n=1 Tax=Flavobacterium sp. 9AF TaxID=2653142 RepID=UPI0012F14534|nr:hypothetical protein [Flavobacterium sp. 9AF]VXC27399.1 hypothetical protein FLAVO9AF_750040 [Flavobacterium sp. 9AF]
MKKIPLLFLLILTFGFSQEEIKFENCTSKKNTSEINWCLMEEIPNKLNLEFNSQDINFINKYNKTQITIKYKIISTGNIELVEIITDASDFIPIVEKFLKKISIDVSRKDFDKYFDKISHIKFFLIKNSKTDSISKTPKEVDSFITQPDSPTFIECKNLNPTEKRECLDKGLQNHFIKNFILPSESKQTTNTSFIITLTINEEGYIDLIDVKRGDEFIKEEIMRIYKLLPKLEPALLNNVPTKINYSFPINIKLQ